MWRAWELLGDRVVGATSLVQPRESREVAVESPGGHVTEPGEKRLGCRVGRASRGRAVPSVPRTRTSGAPPRPSLRARGRKPPACRSTRQPGGRAPRESLPGAADAEPSPAAARHLPRAAASPSSPAAAARASSPACRRASCKRLPSAPSQICRPPHLRVWEGHATVGSKISNEG